MSTISQLSPGDKLSLKGKIFELQKRLNLLDVSQQNTEEYPFKPEITSYELPGRQKNFIENINRAEVIRKEKQDQLKHTLALEESEHCTFRPIVKATQNFKTNKIKQEKPVYIRLTEKGLKYNENREKRVNVRLFLIHTIHSYPCFTILLLGLQT